MIEVREGRLVRLGSHCYCVESTPRGAANAGIVVGREAMLLVDTRLTPALGRDLVDVAHRLAGRRLPLYFVNTHFHGDHCLGNEACAEGVGISSERTRRELDAQWNRQVEVFGALRPDQRSEFAAAAKVLPTIGVSGAMTLDLGGAQAVVQTVGPAHTGGDVVVRIGEDGVMFAGDLLYHGHWPVLKYGDLRGWLETLDWLLGQECDTYVPGHGEVGGHEVVSRMKRCFAFLLRQADIGATSEGIASAVKDSEFGGWLHGERIPQVIEQIRTAAETDEALPSLAD